MVLIGRPTRCSLRIRSKASFAMRSVQDYARKAARRRLGVTPRTQIVLSVCFETCSTTRLVRFSTQAPYQHIGHPSIAGQWNLRGISLTNLTI
jgi:hypothetical protein